jgi:hypothetical protein
MPHPNRTLSGTIYSEASNLSQRPRSHLHEGLGDGKAIFMKYIAYRNAKIYKEKEVEDILKHLYV